MADIISQRETFIVISNDTGLYPATDLYPSEDLYPEDPGTITVTNIVAGSLKLSTMIAENVPQFGKIFASKFECTVFLTPDVKGKQIQVYQVDGANYVPIFTGYIDSCKLDNLGTDRKIVAYDYAYRLSKVNIAEWWTNYWKTRTETTLKECRDSMCAYFDVDCEDVELPNDYYNFPKSVDLNNCSFNEMLRMMCELNYVFPHFNGLGLLTFIMLQPRDDVENLVIKDITGQYEWAKSSFENYETMDITGVQFYDSTDQLKQTEGDSTNAYPIRKNIFLYEADATALQRVARVLLENFSKINFTPATVKMITSDWSLELGDFVHTSKGDFYVFQNSFSGVQFFEQTLKAKGEQIPYGGAKHFNYSEIILGEKYGRVIQDVDNFIVEYGNFRDGELTRITQTAEKISSEAIKKFKDGTELSTKIEQTAGKISSDAIKTFENGDTLKTKIEQTADKISSDAIKKFKDGTDLSTKIEQTATNISSSAIEKFRDGSELSSKIQQNSKGVSIEVIKNMLDKKGDKAEKELSSKFYSSFKIEADRLSSIFIEDVFLNKNESLSPKFKTSVQQTARGVSITASKEVLGNVLDGDEKTETDKTIKSLIKSLNSKIKITAGELESTFRANLLNNETFTSKISQNATSVSSKITNDAMDQLLNRKSTANNSWSKIDDATRRKALGSQIDQKIDGITLEVTNGKSSSTIELKGRSAGIISRTIEFTGTVTFEDLYNNKKTKIKGDYITTGTIDASKVTVTNLNASNITTGTLSASKIKGGTLTIDGGIGGASTIVVKKSGSDIVTINKDGVVIGKSNKTTIIDETGLYVGNKLSGVSGATIKIDGTGSIKVGQTYSAADDVTTIGKGSISIKAKTNVALSIDADSSSKAAINIKAASKQNAINVTQGNTSVQALSCTSLTINSKAISASAGHCLIKPNSTNDTLTLSAISTYELADTTLWAVDASSAPILKSSGGIWGFSTKPTFKKIELKSSSSKVYGIKTSGSKPPTFSKALSVYYHSL